MSNQVLPSFAGQRWPFTRGNLFRTTIKEAASGREYRWQNWSYPRYEWKLDFEVLRENEAFTEMRTLLGFINARGGSFDSFLFTDPDDNTITAQLIGTGDGLNKLFQLVRTLGGFVEPIYDTNGAPQIYVNAVLQTAGTHYTINSAGLVAFVTAPLAGQAVTATFSYYWRCRFTKDGYEFSQMLQRLWDLRGLGFISLKP
jgi:uncharacterized protein (TIGR02217 family)